MPLAFLPREGFLLDIVTCSVIFPIRMPRHATPPWYYRGRGEGEGIPLSLKRIEYCCLSGFAIKISALIFHLCLFLLSLPSSPFSLSLFLFFLFSLFFLSLFSSINDAMCSRLSSSVITSKTLDVFVSSSLSLLNAIFCDYWLAWSMIGKSYSKKRNSRCSMCGMQRLLSEFFSQDGCSWCSSPFWSVTINLFVSMQLFCSIIFFFFFFFLPLSFSPLLFLTIFRCFDIAWSRQ